MVEDLFLSQRGIADRRKQQAGRPLSRRITSQCLGFIRPHCPDANDDRDRNSDLYSCRHRAPPLISAEEHIGPGAAYQTYGICSASLDPAHESLKIRRDHLAAWRHRGNRKGRQA